MEIDSPLIYNEFDDSLFDEEDLPPATITALPRWEFACDPDVAICVTDKYCLVTMMWRAPTHDCDYMYAPRSMNEVKVLRSSTASLEDKLYVFKDLTLCDSLMPKWMGSGEPGSSVLIVTYRFKTMERRYITPDEWLRDVLVELEDRKQKALSALDKLCAPPPHSGTFGDPWFLRLLGIDNV